MTVNPENYAVPECQGRRHEVRYEKGHLCSILESGGFEIERFEYGKEWVGQSAIYLRPRSDKAAALA